MFGNCNHFKRADLSAWKPSEKKEISLKKNRHLNLLALSGASTKIVGEVAIARYLIRVVGYRPDVITGISAGGLLCVPIALGKWRELDELMSSFDLSTIFDQLPVRKNGKINPRAIIRAIAGKEGLGTMKNLEKNLEKLISPREFCKYQEGNYPTCIVMAYDIIKMERKYVNLKLCTYDEFIKYTVAGASIPVFADPVEWKGMQLVDGGVVDHTISAYAMETFAIKNCVSIYARPEQYKTQYKKARNIVQVYERVLDAQLRETSYNDEWKEKAIAKSQGINWAGIYMPDVLKSTYDVDRTRLNRLEFECREIIRKKYHEGVFNNMART